MLIASNQVRETAQTFRKAIPKKTQFGNRKFKIPRKSRTRFSAMKMESISTWETPLDIWKIPKRVDLIAAKLNKKYFLNRNRFPLYDARARSAPLPADLSLVVLLSAVHHTSRSLTDSLSFSLSPPISSTKLQLSHSHRVLIAAQLIGASRTRRCSVNLIWHARLSCSAKKSKNKIINTKKKYYKYTSHWYVQYI